LRFKWKTVGFLGARFERVFPSLGRAEGEGGRNVRRTPGEWREKARRWGVKVEEREEKPAPPRAVMSVE
jgi:hypothetical protein